MNVSVCDFDGTLIRRNSFPLWVIFVLKRSLFNGNFSVSWLFLSSLIKRKLGLIGHEEFKARLVSADYSVDFDLEFVRSLQKYVNGNLVECLSGSGDVVLSSAAPQRYLGFVNEVFGTSFNEIIGSCHRGVGFFDNFAGNKVVSLGEICLVDKCRYVFTDHHDDLPIMMVAEKVYLVSPSSETITRVSAAGIAFEVLE